MQHTERAHAQRAHARALHTVTHQNISTAVGRHHVPAALTHCALTQDPHREPFAPGCASPRDRHTGTTEPATASCRQTSRSCDVQARRRRKSSSDPFSHTQRSTARRTHAGQMCMHIATRSPEDASVLRRCPKGLLREVPVHTRPEQCRILDDTRPAQAQSTTFLHMVNFDALRRSLYDPPTSSPSLPPRILPIRESCPCPQPCAS